MTPHTEMGMTARGRFRFSPLLSRVLLHLPASACEVPRVRGAGAHGVVTSVSCRVAPAPEPAFMESKAVCRLRPLRSSHPRHWLERKFPPRRMGIKKAKRCLVQGIGNQCQTPSRLIDVEILVA